MRHFPHVAMFIINMVMLLTFSMTNCKVNKKQILNYVGHPQNLTLTTIKMLIIIVYTCPREE